MFAKKSTVLFGLFIVVIALSLLVTNPAHAAPLVNFPVTVTQPDGTKLYLFASGDEFYNWLADAQGYTVIQDPVTGYYVYADLVSGKLVPTAFVAGRVNPASVGLRPYLNISPEQKSKIRQAFLDQTKQAVGEVRSAPHTGTITNLVVFIRFSDESEFTDATSRYTNLLNNSSAGADSLRNYYREASYNALTVDSTLLPAPGTTVVSYQNGQPRGYYQPYNVATNTIGYQGGDNGTERRDREHTLLHDAITYVSGLGQFPSGASIDGDGDGIVDSLTFIVSGSPTGWASLLWPHQWNLFTHTATINGKTVGNYSFHLNSSLDTGVLAHEMFHVLGAPDLYHYSYDGFTPVGAWDVMEATQDPPQHMGCYMKFKYGLWISSIPELTSAGTYTLNPLTSSTNNCYKIASPYSATEYFVLEYRNGAGSTFESMVPGTGLLVYRINTLESGNANGPPDEVYIYRPGGTLSVDGSVNTANFSSNVGRTAINDSTDPSSFLSDGSAGGLSICNVGASNATISFDICPGSTFTISGYVRTNTLTGISGVTMSGLPHSPTTDASGFYTDHVYNGWSGTVTPSKTAYVFNPINLGYTNVTSDQLNQNYTGTYQPAQVLLVDDDDNVPDVRSYYTNTLTALGKTYDVWNTNNSDTEPGAADLAPYDTVIWFTGHEFGGYAGPGSAGESALGSWLNGGGCFLISSQDYYYDRGLTSFASTYLGVSAATSDVVQTTVTGAGSVFGGLGPYTLSYPSFNNYSDLISPNATAENAFSGDQGNAAVDKNGGAYHTAYFGFPFEAIALPADRQLVMSTFLNWCATNTYTLSVSKTGTGSGTVTSSPGGITCGATCSHSFNYNTSVTLTATAATGSTFTGWSGSGCSGTGTCTVILSTAKSVTATFTLNTYLLSVGKTGTGSGTVTSSPGGITCGATCSHSFNYNTSVTLTATAAAGSTFTGWSGSGCSGTGTCTVIMDATKSVTASFTLIPYLLSVGKTGTGSGTVTSSPGGITCGATCSHSFNYNTSVTLTATAATGSTFTGWSGSGCSGTGTCTMILNAAKSVTATFTLNIRRIYLPLVIR